MSRAPRLAVNDCWQLLQLIVSDGDCEWIGPVFQACASDSEVLERVVLGNLQLAAFVDMSMQQLLIENLRVTSQWSPPSPPLSTLSP